MNVENPVVSRERNRSIIRCSLYGIVLNICLAVIKLAAGLMVRSTAIMLEALDSLSDSFSSVVSIISATIADQGPSKDHPMGLGRIEYLTSVGFDCTDRDDPLALEIEDRIVQCAMDRDDIERVYGIMVDREEKIISFYIVCSLAFSEWNRVREEFRWQISEMYPDMKVEINYSRLF